MANIVVLGAGMVGSEIGRDLERSGHEVLIMDKDMKVLGKSGVKQVFPIDMTNTQALSQALDSDDIDLVVCAVPGWLGYETLATIIHAGKDCIDISFPEKDSMDLDTAAKKAGVKIVIDCGVAPGMCNVLLGHAVANNKVKSYKCMVGGLPTKRDLPYQYKAPYSPSDVVEFYNRPARIMRGGDVIVLDAFSEPELVDTPVGTLEAFNTDGLRSLLRTMGVRYISGGYSARVPHMVEKTFRWPGHRDFMVNLKDGGFFDADHIRNTEDVLFDKWKLNPEDGEFTYMRIDIKTSNSSYYWEVMDTRTDGIGSMSRVTGYTATAGVGLLLDGKIQPGITAPETLGESKECFKYILKHLKDRGVNYELHRV